MCKFLGYADTGFVCDRYNSRHAKIIFLLFDGQCGVDLDAGRVLDAQSGAAR